MMGKSEVCGGEQTRTRCSPAWLGPPLREHLTRPAVDACLDQQIGFLSTIIVTAGGQALSERVQAVEPALPLDLTFLGHGLEPRAMTP